MVHVEFTSQLAQHVDCPSDQSVDASALSEAFDMLFTEHPKLREYVLDEQGAVRSHISIFVDGEIVQQRDLDLPLHPNSEVFVMQAISGG